MMRTATVPLVLAAALAGCAYSDVYRPAVQVMFTSPDSIKLEWDEPRFTLPEAQAMATAYCKGRPIHVVDATRPQSQVQAITWRCGP